MENLWDQQERRLGLPLLNDFVLESQTESILSMTFEDIGRLTPSEAGDAATAISMVSLHIQRVYNRAVAKASWADACIKKILSKVLPRTPGYSYEERRQAALADSPAAMEYEIIRVENQLVADRLNFLSAKLTEVKKSLFNKQGQNQYQN